MSASAHPQSLAEAHARAICFYDRTDPPQERQLCPELAQALAAMRRVEPLKLLVMGHTNPKAPEFVCVLDRTPSMAAIEAAQEACADLLPLRINADGITCVDHWSELTWGDPLPTPEPSPPLPEMSHWLAWVCFLTLIAGLAWLLFSLRDWLGL